MTIASLPNCQQASFTDIRPQADKHTGIVAASGLLDHQAAFCSDTELNGATRRQAKRRHSLRKLRDVNVERSGRLQWFSADFHAIQAV